MRILAFGMDGTLAACRPSRKTGEAAKITSYPSRDEAFDDLLRVLLRRRIRGRRFPRANRRYPQAPCAPARANTTSRNPAASGCRGTRSAPSAAACARRIAESPACPPSAGRAARRACWLRATTNSDADAFDLLLELVRAFSPRCPVVAENLQIDQQRVAGGHRRSSPPAWRCIRLLEAVEAGLEIKQILRRPFLARRFAHQLVQPFIAALAGEAR